MKIKLDAAKMEVQCCLGKANMKTRIYVYGLTIIGIIVFFTFMQKWKYDREKERLSQLNQALKLDEMRFVVQEANVEQVSFNAKMEAIKANAYARDETIKALDNAQEELKQKHKAELENDRRRIEEFSRDHGF